MVSTSFHPNLPNFLLLRVLSPYRFGIYIYMDVYMISEASNTSRGRAEPKRKGKEKKRKRESLKQRYY